MRPNFLGIGAGRAGTTTIHDLIKDHPDVYMPAEKECHFFINGITDQDVENYEAKYFSLQKSEKAVGEITPAYLYYPGAASQIKKYLGEDTKLLVTLRHPVKRAYSHYLYNVKLLSDEMGSFEEAMTIESRDTRGMATNYFNGSLYTDYLKEYLSIFSKENFMFIIFERDICQQIEKMTYNILKFLGVSTDYLFNPRTLTNRSLVPKLQYYAQETIVDVKHLTGQMVKYKVPENTILSTTGYQPWDKMFANPSNEFKQQVFQLRDHLEKGLDPDFEAYLMKEYFIDDVKMLEDLVDIDLSLWYSEYL